MKSVLKVLLLELKVSDFFLDSKVFRADGESEGQMFSLQFEQRERVEGMVSTETHLLGSRNSL